MSKKFLTVDVNGSYPEVLGYSTDEFVAASTGVADAGKPVALDAAGLLDSSMVNASGIDHGLLGGLGDDDHVIYSKADGTRDYTGIVSYNAHPTFNADTQLVDKKYVDDLAREFSWLPSVLDRLNAPPVSPSAGQRYLIDTAPTGDWVGHANEIAEWNGTAWVYTAPAVGNKVVVEDDPNAVYLFDGVNWLRQLYEATTASNGLVKVGEDIQVDPSLAGNGLAFTTGVMSVNVDNSSLEITADTLNVKALGITDAMLAGSISDGKLASDYIQTSEVDNVSIEFAGGNLNVKDDGVNALKIDWGLGANQVSASDVPIADSGDHTAETNVEGSLQELYGLISERGVELTSAGVAKGDLLYISAADTLAKYATITTFHKAVGLASATVGALGAVKSLSNDTVLAGVLAGATPGDVYYWDGTNHVSTIPVTPQAYVIQTGVAINATDLYVEVRPVKKNI